MPPVEGNGIQSALAAGADGAGEGPAGDGVDRDSEPGAHYRFLGTDRRPGVKLSARRESAEIRAITGFSTWRRNLKPARRRSTMRPHIGKM